ncbi:MAG TPA: hypothetical protein VJP77_05190, partial [Planctomycetota bacterium]|nr:hypothetical protein [Planctomycetota bacterium]
VLATTFATVLALAENAAAQCAGPDLLSGPCCAPAQAHLPAFPGFGLPGAGLCYDACNPLPKTALKVDLTTPVPTPVCAEFTSMLRVSDGGGAPLLEGVLVLDYTRTWAELAPVAPAPIEYQVFRFAAKGDLRRSPGAPPLCPVPACLPAQPTAFYYGYVDFALNCTTGGWEHALVLFHGCDWLIHRPGLSDRPGAFHPTRSYAIAAPDTAANPFVPAFSPPTGGAVVEEALRDVLPPFGPGVCQTEEPVLGGAYLPLGSGCLCPFATLPVQQTAKLLDSLGTCPDPTGVPSGAKSVNLFPTAPWIHLLSTAIGRWSTPASYPGPEAAWVVEGLTVYRDACDVVPGAGGREFLEIDYGAETDNGYTILPDLFTGVLLPDEFLDLASNYSLPSGVPAVFPVLGSVRPTDHLVYLNTP